jgi:Flp pilus assembly protein TadG
MLRRLLASRRSNVTVEFAIVGPVFLFLLLFVFEIAYDNFLQEVLDSATAFSARQMQIGLSQNSTSGADFLNKYLCPNGFGLLNCNGVFVRVEVLNSSQSSTCADVYNATTGNLPVSGNASTGYTLQLGSFAGTQGAGAGTSTSPSTCDTTSSQGYCNPGPSEFVLLTTIYVGPSFMNGLIPTSRLYTYNGSPVRAQMSGSAFETDNFTASPATSTGC